MFIRVIKGYLLFLIIFLMIFTLSSVVKTSPTKSLLELMVGWVEIHYKFDGHHFKGRDALILSSCYLQDYFVSDEDFQAFSEKKKWDIVAIDGMGMSNDYFFLSDLLKKRNMKKVIILISPLDLFQNGRFATNFMIQNIPLQSSLLKMALAQNNWQALAVMSGKYMNHMITRNTNNPRPPVQHANDSETTGLSTLKTSDLDISLRDSLQYLHKLLSVLKKHSVPHEFYWIEGNPAESRKFAQKFNLDEEAFIQKIKNDASRIFEKYGVRPGTVNSLSELDSIVESSSIP